MKLISISQLLKKIICSYVILSFTGQMIFPSTGFSEILSSSPAMNFPQVGSMVSLSDTYQSAAMRGMQMFSENPFRFNFIVDAGDSGLDETTLKDEADRLIRYFYASLTVPEKELWVNLSPYEKDRIVPDSFGVTEMGRDLLAQDYLLKQITASLMYPEGETGKKFWERVYQKAYEMYGTMDVPMDTFNKVWIVPDEAGIYVEDDKVFIIDSHLKVMLEEDYVALSRSYQESGIRDQYADSRSLTPDALKQIIRDVMIPEIEKEVNEGKNFAPLRQVYQSLILATWFKRNLKESLLVRSYADQNKISGIDLQDKNIKQNIYDRYLEAFKKGVYDYIKDEYDPAAQSIVPRKYFSGGFSMAMLDQQMQKRTFDDAQLAFAVSKMYKVEAGGDMVSPQGVEAVKATDAAMMGKVYFGNEKQKPVLPDGWTFLVHNTHLAKHEWNRNYLTLHSENEFVVNKDGLFTNFIEDKEDLNHFLNNDQEGEDLLKSLIRQYEVDKYELRNSSAQIRVIFPKADYKVGEGKIKDLIEAYYLNDTSLISQYPVVPEGQKLIKIAQIMEDVIVGGIPVKIKVFYFVPEGLLEDYRLLVADQTVKLGDVDHSNKHSEIGLHAQEQFNNGKALTRKLEFNATNAPKIRMLEGGQTIKVETNSSNNIFLLPDQTLSVDQEPIDVDRDLTAIGESEIYKELNIELGNKMSDLGLTPPITAFGLIAETPTERDQWSDTYYFWASERVFPVNDVAPDQKWLLVENMLEALFKNNIFIENLEVKNILIGTTKNDQNVKAYVANFESANQETQTLSQYIDRFLTVYNKSSSWKEFDSQGKILQSLMSLGEDQAMMNIGNKMAQFVMKFAFLKVLLSRFKRISKSEDIAKKIDVEDFSVPLTKIQLRNIVRQYNFARKNIPLGEMFDFALDESGGTFLINYRAAIHYFFSIGSASDHLGVVTGMTFYKDKLYVSFLNELPFGGGVALKFMVIDPTITSRDARKPLGDWESFLKLPESQDVLSQLKQNNGMPVLVERSDPAMMNIPQQTNDFTKGGIDLNSDLLKINQEGSSNSMMNSLTNKLMDKDFIGVVPFIIDIKPLNIFTLLTGKSRDKSSDTAQNNLPQTAFLKE